MDLPARDQPGPSHSPVVERSDVIEGVVVMTPPSILYPHGILTELLRPEWGDLVRPEESVTHLYAISAPNGGTREEWYLHKHTVDRYLLLLGELRVGLFDARENSPTRSGFQIVELGVPGGPSPSGLRIPAGVWHTLDWLSSPGLVVNSKYPPYDRLAPDKYRVPIDQIPEGFDLRG